MKVRAARSGPIPPADPLSRRALETKLEMAGYDAMMLESGIVSYVVGERSADGASLFELTRELSGDPRFGEASRPAIEAAVRGLVDGQLLRMRGQTVLPGPVFGSSAAADPGPGRN